MTATGFIKRISILLVLSLLSLPAAAGCFLGQGDFNVEVMTVSGELAPMPYGVESFLVVNRYDGDKRERAQEALAGLRDTMDKSPFFYVAGPTVDMGVNDKAWMPAPMRVDEVVRLCEQHGAGALLVLEVFSTDRTRKVKEKEREVKDKDGNKTKETYYKATADYWTGVGWRIYDGQSGYVIDQFLEEDSRKVSAEGPTRSAAKDGLSYPLQASKLGNSFARRITPLVTTQERFSFCAGSPEIKQAYKAMKRQQWVEAESLLRKALNNKKPKVQRRAAFDLAVFAELQGDLEGALAQAQIASKDYGSKRAREYSGTLQRRIRQERLVEERMQGRVGRVQ